MQFGIGMGIGYGPKKYIDPYNAENWAASVIANGGTYSANTLAALSQLDADLTLFGYKSRIIRASIIAGDNIQAAMVPYIWRDGHPLDVLRSGTLAPWVEANGLVNGVAGVVGLGITGADTNHDELSIGVYSLANQAPVANAFILGRSDGLTGLGLVYDTQAHGNDTTWMDGLLHRVQTNFSIAPHDGEASKGFIGASTKASTGKSALVRNGEIRSLTQGGNAGATPSSAEFRINTARVPLGFYMIAEAYLPEELMNIAWMVHDCNRTIGRGVVADGMV